MKLQVIRTLALPLSVLMIFGAVLTSCGDSNGGDTEITESDSLETSGVGSENVSDDTGDSEGEAYEEVTEYEEILNYEGSKTVEYADHIKDGSNAYYLDSVRSAAVVENMNMRLVHGLNGNQANTNVKNLINSLENKRGGVYISDTMDVFVKTAKGNVYYASDWMTGSSFNILRGGFYYNEARIQDQGFGDIETVMANSINVDLSTFGSTTSNQLANLKYTEEGVLEFNIVNTGKDPGVHSTVSLQGLNISSKDYNALLITMKTEAAYMAEVFVKTHKMSNYSQACAKHISLIHGDDFHTYVVRLDDLGGYNGILDGIRIDLGALNGEFVQIQSIKAVNIENNTVPVRLDRGLHAYSDKLHQEIHLVTTAKTKDLSSYGMVTEIAADTVAKLIVADHNGKHTTLDGVDWRQVRYVAFDIRDVGIFGYILPANNSGDTLTVVLENGKYIITQEHALDAGKLYDKYTNFYMGHRIYTDETHNFAAFEKEAYVEQNPLGADNIVVVFDNMNKAKFAGYDYLRGAYKITIHGTAFSNAYYQIWNRHYTAPITVKGDDVNRKMYMYTASSSGALECAALLNKDQLMLPVALEVIKNFGGDGEESIFVKDNSYSETYLPLKIDASSEQSFNILNLYQNWGKYPLKQLSWIQYVSPYYHLSTGVTETNCISLLYTTGPSWKTVHDPSAGDIDEFFVVSGKSLSTLPDFRAMSGILWKDQPQHNSCMDISWLQYKPSDGEKVASDFVKDAIASYGPTYADITLDYISDDGKIEASYRHAEMPQTDENRTYYTLRYDVKDTINIDSFKDNFNIIETDSRFGPYQYIGYLNENGECTVEEADRSGERRFITLGKEAPYFGYFYYYLASSSNMCNYAVIIKNWDIVLGGEKYDGNFLIEERFDNNLNYTRLTLDIGDIFLRKGDYIDINMILLPWGKANDTEDINVRQVRQDSCLNPYKVEASVGTVIEDDFIPMIKAENNAAEFTFSGGHNNGVVRIYGFDILTRPTVHELVDGDWVEYDLTSVTNPDKNQNAHYYDGYCVHYDGNGLYSYSFVIPTEQGAERRFKVVAEEFKGYPADPSPALPDPEIDEDSNNSDELVDPDEARPEGEGAPTLYFSAQDLYLIAKDENTKTYMLDEASLRKESGIKFARYLTYGMENQDGYIVLHSDADNSLNAAPYLAVKYRTKTPNASVEFWLNSNDISYLPGEGNIHMTAVGDGEWNYMIIDLSTVASCFNGRKLHLLRLDFLNSSTPALPANSYIDIAYIGFFKTESEAGKFEFGDEYKTKDEIKRENYALCVDPESGYTLSEVVYGTQIDYINGEKVNWTAGNSKEGVSVIDFARSTLEDGSLAISGWTVVDGGVAKYIWSADGGKTWFKTGVSVIERIGNGAGTPHYNVVNSKIGKYSFAEGSNINSTYQKEGGVGGITINLSAYDGEIVDVVFAAVPAKDVQAVCPLILIKNVVVSGSSNAPDADEMLTPSEDETGSGNQGDGVEIKDSDLVASDSGYTLSETVYGANLDFINAQALNDQGGNSKTGCSIYANEITTFSSGKLVFTGWTVVDGGVKDYVWSMDGGKTWTVISGKPGDGAGQAHYNVLSKRMGEYAFSEGSNIKSTFQGAQAAGENIGGLAVDLSAYAGQTISLTFAAIPLNDIDGLCLIAHLTNVKVATN